MIYLWSTRLVVGVWKTCGANRSAYEMNVPGRVECVLVALQIYHVMHVIESFPSCVCNCKKKSLGSVAYFNSVQPRVCHKLQFTCASSLVNSANKPLLLSLLKCKYMLTYVVITVTNMSNMNYYYHRSITVCTVTQTKRCHSFVTTHI